METDEEPARILAGLAASQPRISHVYMYDDRGSELYEQITRTEEYYPTHTELKLLQQHAGSIATFPPTELEPGSETQTLCELGAGDGHKTLVLLTAMAAKAPEIVYAPIDVSKGALDANVAAFDREQFEGGGVVRVHPFCGMYESCLPEARALPGRKSFMWLGSSLGNYSDAEGIDLLSLVREQMSERDRFLLGVDTPHGPTKPAEVIHRAYNDAAGITAAFTLNALRHVNQIAGLDFDWEHGWRHVAEYDEEQEAIVTHVEAVTPQVLSRGEGAAKQQLHSYAAGQRIFVEQSRKFSLAAVQRLAKASGLAVARHWTAKDEWHIVAELVLVGCG